MVEILQLMFISKPYIPPEQRKPQAKPGKKRGPSGNLYLKITRYNILKYLLFNQQRDSEDQTKMPMRFPFVMSVMILVIL